MLRLRGFKVFLLILSILLFVVSYSHAGNIPQVINYSGTLTKADGTPATNGNYNMEFKIYDVASGGVALWTEKWDTTTSQVTVVNGGFNVMLGNFVALPSSFFADHPTAFLGIKVGTDSEMLPRQQITSVGYSFSAGNGVPKGGIIMWSGAVNQIPFGWGLCDGTNGTPDLRDRFIVGAGSGYGVGSTGGSSAINLAHVHTINSTGTNHSHWVNDHTLTINEMPAHTHDMRGNYDTVGQGHPTHSTNSTAVPVATSSTGGGAPHNHGWTGTMDMNSSHSHTEDSQLSSAQDIRPPYYALAFIMKL